MDRRRYTRETLQAEADRWVEVLTAKGFTFPDAPIIVYTNGRQHDTAAGLPRGFTTRAESYLLRHQPDEYFDEIKRWQRLGVPSHTKSTGLPVVYIRLQFPRAYFGGRRGKRNPLFELLHELMHLVIPHLPNWKAHELTTEIYLNPARPSMTERLIRKARSRAHLAWLKADAWDLDGGWPAPTLCPTMRPTATTAPPPARSALGRFMFKQSDADADGAPQ